MCEIMKILKVIITTYVILDVLAQDMSYENEMDLIIDMLLKNEVKEYTDSIQNAIEEANIAEPVYSNGAWKCGKCEDINESRLVYTETYNVEVNDDGESSINLQVGLSLQKVSCVIITSGIGELRNVERMEGNCAGEGTTLLVTGAGAFDVKVYG